MEANFTFDSPVKALGLLILFVSQLEQADL